MKKKIRPAASYPEPRPAGHLIEEAAASYGIRCEVINVREARDQLSRLLDRAASGEQIVITSDGQPKAMIVRYRPVVTAAKWISKRALRLSMPVSPDSAPLIRKLRDSSY